MGYSRARETYGSSVTVSLTLRLGRHDVTRRFGGERSGLKDRTVVAFEDIEPRSEVVRMANGRCHPEFSAQESGAELCDQFLTRISLTAKTTREIAVET